MVMLDFKSLCLLIKCMFDGRKFYSCFTFYLYLEVNALSLTVFLYNNNISVQ